MVPFKRRNIKFSKVKSGFLICGLFLTILMLNILELWRCTFHTILLSIKFKLAITILQYIFHRISLFDLRFYNCGSN